jgi:hypothetical protein
MDAFFRFGLRFSLADATGDGRAFSDIHAVFILEYGDKKSHFSSSGRNSLSQKIY